MEVNGNGHRRAARTGEHKSSSPDELQLRALTPAGAGDITPKQSRTGSPFNFLSLQSALSDNTSDNDPPASEDTHDAAASVDRSSTSTVTALSHAHQSDSDSDVYDSLHLSSLNSPYPSRSLTPKNLPAASVSANADGPAPDDEDMPNSSPRSGGLSGPPRSAASRRQQQQQQNLQQQQRGLPPYGYYASPSASESGFSRNPPSLSGQGAPPSFAHTHAQQPPTPQRSTSGYVGQYTMSPSPSMYSSQQQQHQYGYAPQLSMSGHGMPPLPHAHSSQDFFSVSQSQAPLYAPSFAPPAIHTSAPPEHASGLSYDYDGGGSTGRSSAAGVSTPYTPQQPFQQFNYHPTLTATPQFTHTHSSFSSPFQPQHAQRPQYPPSYGYLAAASPTSPEEVQQQQTHGQWWYIPPPHSASPSTGPYASMYYLDAYGNPSNPGMGFSGPSTSPSRAMQPSSFSSMDAGAGTGLISGPGMGLGPAFGVGHADPQRVADSTSRPESISSSVQGPLSPSSVAPGESVSERGGNQQQQSQQQSQTKHSRRSMLPNPPAHRSEWVMWVGNVPSDATHDELWKFFARPITPIGTSPTEARSPYYHQQLHQPPHLPAGLLSPSGSSSASDATPAGGTGVASVFLIARSNCAFVNYTSAAHLSAAVTRFNGIPLRPGDPRCPRLVCRVRGKDEDQRAGVGGQRGMGMHTRWIKEQHERERQREMDVRKARRKEESVSDPPDTPSSVGLGESGAESAHEAPHHDIRRPPHHSSSSGSTTSGFLARYFPKRYFILKSLTQFDLDLSVEKGVWATQPHNETVLNQAFRTSSDVFLIFSVNKSGEFFGYAKMASPIGKSAEDRVSWASRTDSQPSHSPAMSFASSVAGRNSQVGETIKEEDEDSSPESKERQLKAERDLVKQTERERRPIMLFSPGEHRAEDSPQPVTPQEEQSLQIVEGNSGRKSADKTGEASTAPPSDRHLRKQQDSLPGGRGGRPSLRPNSPTSAPAIMGQPHRRITNPLVEGLSSETMDPRILRHRLPSVELDPVAPMRAVRDHDESMRAVREQEERGVSEEQPTVGDDRVKRKDTFNKSKSGSSGSKFHGVSQPEPIRAPTSPTSGPEETMTGPSLQSQITADAHPGVEMPAQWGTPFKVQWVRVGRLPFHRTRHLRNPWNHEREVKVSRDGTELEPGVGQALLDEWDKEEPPPSATPASSSGPGVGPASPIAGRRGFQSRRIQPQAQMQALSLEGEAGPRPNSPRASQQKPRPH